MKLSGNMYRHEKIRKEKKNCLTHCTNKCQCLKGTLAHSYCCQRTPFTKLSNMWDFDRFFRVGSILKRNMLVAEMLFQIPRPSKKMVVCEFWRIRCIDLSLPNTLAFWKMEVWCTLWLAEEDVCREIANLIWTTAQITVYFLHCSVLIQRFSEKCHDNITMTEIKVNVEGA